MGLDRQDIKRLTRILEDFDFELAKEEKEGLQGLVVCHQSYDYNDWHLVVGPCNCCKD